ncbi:MAG: thioesterase [Eubacteriales bacterium]|nr:thioesterase [Eubacteriales bacterium]
MSTQLSPDRHTIYQTDLRPSDCDFERLIFPHTVFMLGQFAAEKDIELCPALSLAHLEGQKLKWMISASSYYFTGLRPAKGSQVISESWSPGIKGINFLRSHLIFAENRQADRLVAHGASRWFVVDRDSRKPVRPLDLVSQEAYLDYSAPSPDLDFRPLRLAAEEGDSLYRQDFAIAYSLLDDNYHLNNVNYVSLALDCLWSYFVSQAWSWQSYQIRELHFNYLAEVKAGQTLTISISEGALRPTPNHSCLLEGQKLEFTSRKPLQYWVLTGRQAVEAKHQLAFRALVVLEEK